MSSNFQEMMQKRHADGSDQICAKFDCTPSYLNVLRICEITACFKSPNSGCYGYHLSFLSLKKIIHLPYNERDNINCCTCIQDFMSFDTEMNS